MTLQAGSTVGGSGTLEVNGTTTVTGNLSLPVAVSMTGSLSGAGKITMTPPLTWTSGTINLAGGLDVESGQTLSIVSGNTISSRRARCGTAGPSCTRRGLVYIVSGNSTVLNDVGAGALGTLTIGGGFLGFTNSGTIDVRIGGAAAGQFDVVNVTGQATLAGTLNAQLVNGFVPALANEFPVMTYGPRTGTFGSINGNGHTFATCYGATSFKLGEPGNPTFCGGT